MATLVVKLIRSMKYMLTLKKPKFFYQKQFISFWEYLFMSNMISILYQLLLEYRLFISNV